MINFSATISHFLVQPFGLLSISHFLVQPFGLLAFASVQPFGLQCNFPCICTKMAKGNSGEFLSKINNLCATLRVACTRLTGIHSIKWINILLLVAQLLNVWDSIYNTTQNTYITFLHPGHSSWTNIYTPSGQHIQPQLLHNYRHKICYICY